MQSAPFGRVSFCAWPSSAARRPLFDRPEIPSRRRANVIVSDTSQDDHCGIKTKACPDSSRVRCYCPAARDEGNRHGLCSTRRNFRGANSGAAIHSGFDDGRRVGRTGLAVDRSSLAGRSLRVAVGPERYFNLWSGGRILCIDNIGGVVFPGRRDRQQHQKSVQYLRRLLADPTQWQRGR